jgi:hypothetical protein
LVHVTGILFFLEKQLYCELLEFQFISTRADTDGGITIPWKTAENKTNGKSVIEQRIAQIRQERSTTAPSPVIIPDDTPKQKRTKISDICKTFLSSSDNGNTSKTNINIDTNVEEQDNNENSEGQESDNDVIIKQENKDVRPEIVQGKDRKVTNRFTFTI